MLAHGRGFTLQLGLLRGVADVRTSLHRRWVTSGWRGAVPSVLRAQLQGCKATAERVGVLLVAEGRSGSTLVGVRQRQCQCPATTTRSPPLPPTPDAQISRPEPRAPRPAPRAPRPTLPAPLPATP